VSSTLRILHCLRAPSGGLFRHVHDLALGQAQLGAEVGIIFDSRLQGDAAVLGRLGDNCALGLTRFPMSRHAGLGDWHITGKITQLAAKLGVDVLHGHGAKGGAYARLAAGRLKRKGMPVKATYTPHGGSQLYSASRVMSRFHIMAERRLLPLSDGLLFESVYAARRYIELVGEPRCPVRVVPNGLYPHEFYEPMLADDAADFVFIGEFRKSKGIDVLLEALAIHQAIFPGRAIIVGSGPEEAALKRLARKLGLNGRVSFVGPRSARTAFARARCVVIPSRAESFPYIALEAAAARMPMILTNVGGIPEIVGDTGVPLIPPGDPEALAAQLRAFLSNPKPFLERAATLQEYVAERFTIENMTNDIVNFYISDMGAGVK
jgi:glycosyltransferase involved in cell wall biosynthesis